MSGDILVRSCHGWDNTDDSVTRGIRDDGSLHDARDVRDAFGFGGVTLETLVTSLMCVTMMSPLNQQAVTFVTT